MHKIFLPLGLFLWSCLFLQARQPNVIFIMVDDLGWMDTSCYGSSFYETPNVDKLADTGMRFTDAYAANPLCSPTRASILTGQYPIRTGFTSAIGHLPGEHKHVERHHLDPYIRAAGPSSLSHLSLDYYTLGEAFKDAGYATAFLGKWHMGFDPFIPENSGFDFVVGGRHHPGPPGLNPQRKFYPPWDSIDTLPTDPADDLHIDKHLTSEAIDYIKEHRDQPFFMCFWLYNVHAPFQADPELVKKWKTRADPANRQHCGTMAAMIEMMDNHVGQILDSLEECGLAEDTIVIFTSDNGGNMYDVSDGTTPTNNWPLRSGKGNNYEGGVRVPLIVRWPGVTQSGSVNHSVVSTVDHYPALLEMTGQDLRPQEHKDGVSYVPALKGEAFNRGATISGFDRFVTATMNIPNTWIRSGDWKLLRFWFDGPQQTHRYELYNLRNDIGESNNLADRFPDKVQVMAAQMDQFYKESGALKPNPNRSYDPRTVGVWRARGEGDIATRDGALSLKATDAFFGARTEVTPSLVSTASLRFEARSTENSELNFQWSSRSEPEMGHSNRMVVSELSAEWQSFTIPMQFSGRIDKLQFLLTNAGDMAELRQVQLLTPDGSVITEYEFY